jgi:hypothetical protein
MSLGTEEYKVTGRSMLVQCATNDRWHASHRATGASFAIWPQPQGWAMIHGRLARVRPGSAASAYPQEADANAALPSTVQVCQKRNRAFTDHQVAGVFLVSLAPAAA